MTPSEANAFAARSDLVAKAELNGLRAQSVEAKFARSWLVAEPSILSPLAAAIASLVRARCALVASEA